MSKRTPHPIKAHPPLRKPTTPTRGALWGCGNIQASHDYHHPGELVDCPDRLCHWAAEVLTSPPIQEGGPDLRGKVVT